jgi:hypothetical protein
MPMRVRSLVGLVPLFATGTIQSAVVDKLHGFKKRTVVGRGRARRCQHV